MVFFLYLNLRITQHDSCTQTTWKRFCTICKWMIQNKMQRIQNEIGYVFFCGWQVMAFFSNLWLTYRLAYRLFRTIRMVATFRWCRELDRLSGMIRISCHMHIQVQNIFTTHMFIQQANKPYLTLSLVWAP